MSDRQTYTESGMTCTDLRRALASGQPSSPEVEAHLASCAPCGELAADDGALADALEAVPEPTADLSDMAAALSEAMEKDGANRRIPSWIQPTVLIGLAAAVAIAMALGSLRPDIAAYPMDLMALILAALGGPTIGLSIAASRPLHKSAIPRGMVAALAVTALSIPLIIAVLPAPHSDPASDITGVFLAATIGCFVLGVLVAGMLVIAHRLLDKRTHADRDALLLVALAGCVAGAFALQIHCPFTDTAHQVIGHAGQGAVFTAGIWALFWRHRAR